MKFVAALLALVTATEATRSLSKARQLDQTQTAAYQQTAVNGDYVYGVYSDIYGNYQANGGYYDPSQNWAQNGGDENGNGWSQAYKDAFSSIYSYTQNAANGQAQAQQQGRENAQSMNYFFTISSEHTVRFKQCVSMKLKDEDSAMFNDDLVYYAMNGDIVGQRSYVIFEACTTGKCDTKQGEHHNFLIELEDWIGSGIDLQSVQDEEICEACANSYDYCAATMGWQNQGNVYAEQGQQQQAYDEEQQAQQQDGQQQADQQQGEQGADGQQRHLAVGRQLATQQVDCATCQAKQCFNQYAQEAKATKVETTLEWVDDLLGCQETGQYWEGYPLYAGFMCNGRGNGAEVALFLDDACTVYVKNASFQTVLNGDGYQGYQNQQAQQQQANGYGEQQGQEDAQQAQAEQQAAYAYNAYRQNYAYGLDMEIASEVVKYPFTHSIDCDETYYEAPGQQGANGNQWNDNADYGYYQWYAHEPTDFCERIFQDNARDVDKCASRAQKYGFMYAYEQAQMNENNYQTSWYSYDLTEEESESSWFTCLALAEMNGKYQSIYDHKSSGTTFDYKSGDGDLQKSSLGDFADSDAGRIAMVVILSLIAAVVIFALYRRCVSSDEKEDDKTFALMDEKPEVTTPSVAVDDTPTWTQVEKAQSEDPSSLA